MDLSNYKTRRLIIIAVLVLVVALVAWFIVSRFQASRGSVQIVAAPIGATITISDRDQPLENNQATNLPAGSYTATISKDGFESQSVELAVINDAPIVRGVVLNPESNDAQREIYSKENQRRILEINRLPGGALVNLQAPLSICDSVRYFGQEDQQSVCINSDESNALFNFVDQYPLARYLEFRIGTQFSQQRLFSDGDLTVDYSPSMSYDLDKPVLLLELPNASAYNEQAFTRTMENHGYNPDNYYLRWLTDDLESHDTIPGSFMEEGHMHDAVHP